VKAHRRVEPEPVFQLTRAFRIHSAIPVFAVQPTRPLVLGLAVQRSRRPLVVRIAGLLALAAALAGSVLIFGQSTAGRQALSWVTLGHADVILRALH
jgi:ABC-type enterochelin transport system permease subunit